MLKRVSIFGREPASWLGLIGALVAVLVGANLPYLTPVQGSAALAVVTALVMAYTTRPISPALLTAVVVTGVALVGTYGVHASEGLVQGLVALTVAVAGFFAVRPQVNPQDTHVLSRP